MSLLLRPQLVMHWLVMHALAKDSPPPLCMDRPSSLLLRFFRQVVLPYLAGTHCTILTSALVFGGNIFTHPLAIVLLYKQHSWSYHQVHKGGSLCAWHMPAGQTQPGSAIATQAPATNALAGHACSGKG